MLTSIVQYVYKSWNMTKCYEIFAVLPTFDVWNETDKSNKNNYHLHHVPFVCNIYDYIC